jgi:hypothetical protein
MALDPSSEERVPDNVLTSRRFTVCLFIFFYLFRMSHSSRESSHPPRQTPQAPKAPFTQAATSTTRVPALMTASQLTTSKYGRIRHSTFGPASKTSTSKTSGTDSRGNAKPKACNPPASSSSSVSQHKKRAGEPADPSDEPSRSRRRHS